ncbi:MAG: 2-pyrone-4,6-dicarboxylate hydrolase [Burkholderia sp.]|nr:2-pyrone-4,6-dicarboxylate hydrolase [Burkholderia sp.]
MDSLVKQSNERPIPHSSGTARPAAQVPPDACDSHLHIIDPRFPLAPGAAAAPAATIEDYRQLQGRIGTTRAVIVQAKVHGTDHGCLLDAIGKLDGKARGIGVLHPTVADAELRRLHDGGIRGLRFSVWNPADTVTTIAMIEPLARRISDFGWHVQLHMSGDQIVEQAALLECLPCPVVIDHMGRLPPTLGVKHPAYAIARRLIDKGNAWIKVSGAYLNTAVGPPSYSDAAALASSWIRAAPERVVWGSDWPHITETHQKPDDALLMDLLAQAAGDRDTLSKILVANPATLYGFA